MSSEMQVRMRLPIKKSGLLRFAAGRVPSDSVIFARLPLAKTRPSAISAESAIIRLRNVARMTGGSGPYSVCDLNLSTKARQLAPVRHLIDKGLLPADPRCLL